MTQLIVKNPIDPRKLDSLLFFLKSWDIDAEILTEANSPATGKFKVRHKSHTPTDAELEERLSKNESIADCSESDDKAIIASHRPVFSNGLEKWL
jgi:hypothetical protein